ncbi:Omp28-related outer membrane protein [Myroides sp. 1354]|uniref:Omp28-related outer membrane protein n=1 Tax=unclassified Myroides TaxID=2642485 RepID=UPI0025765C89|nr:MULTISPECIES: Omp28-related outer membrane protein [unclassified Myroides]MDM1043779.1 Omp28-related outer membrane protein [Myroides sp. R163-1]MDM1054171.1 Omp28-related outer membrane protein [Myroides sp. 1354]MDM1067467.1 Omp28-related outer membrane protein [Myroides sp. 1372]
MKQNKLAAFTKVLLSSLILLVTVYSCGSDDGGKKDDDGGKGKDKTLILQAEGDTRVLENTAVLFKVTGEGNTLADAKLFVNDAEISENPYTFTTEGTYTVMAKKDGYKNSNIVTIKVFKDEVPVTPTGDLKYQHRVLMEDFTGVQCGPCASAIRALERLETHTFSGNGYPVDYSSIVVVGIHVSIPGPDPFALPRFAHPLFDYYNSKVVNDPETQGMRWAPFIVINGKAEWDTRTMTTAAGQNHPMTLVQKTSSIGIKITSGLTTTAGYAEAEIAFSQDYDGLTMDYYIVEDDVQHSQAGIGANYLHHAVLKAATPAITGIAIPAAQSKKGNIFVAERFSSVYKTANADNLRAIVVIRDANGDVLNVQDAKANTTKDFAIID